MRKIILLKIDIIGALILYYRRGCSADIHKIHAIDVIMEEKKVSQTQYSLADLFRNPDTPLTDGQLSDWPKYMAQANGDVSASGVDITGAVEARIKEIDAKRTIWF